jgi:hypothetical protein
MLCVCSFHKSSSPRCFLKLSPNMNVLANRPLWTMPKEESLLLSELSELGIDSDEEMVELVALQHKGDAELAVLKASLVGVVEATTGVSLSGDMSLAEPRGPSHAPADPAATSALSAPGVTPSVEAGAPVLSGDGVTPSAEARAPAPTPALSAPGVAPSAEAGAPAPTPALSAPGVAPSAEAGDPVLSSDGVSSAAHPPSHAGVSPAGVVGRDLRTADGQAATATADLVISIVGDALTQQMHGLTNALQAATAELHIHSSGSEEAAFREEVAGLVSEGMTESEEKEIVKEWEEETGFFFARKSVIYV